MFLFLKKSTEHMKKIPTIILSITYKGVKFIDASNKVSFKCLQAGVWRDKTRSLTCLGAAGHIHWLQKPRLIRRSPAPQHNRESTKVVMPKAWQTGCSWIALSFIPTIGGS